MNKKWKYVSIPQCFVIILISLICLLAFVVPFSISPVKLTYTKLFTKTDSLFATVATVAKEGIPKIIKPASSFTKYFAKSYQYLIYGYGAIIILDIIGAFLLILTRANTIRKFFRFISVIAGLFLIVVAIAFVLYLVGVFGYFSANKLTTKQLLNETAALFGLGMVIFSIFLSAKQFDWFKAPF